jgi:transaldolase
LQFAVHACVLAAIAASQRIGLKEQIMKFFVDTGSLKDVKAIAALGILDGVTTNPSLMAKEADDPRKIIKEICRIVQGPVSAEVVATDYDGMLREGHDLAKIDEHVVVKVPFTKDGVRACKTLSSEGLKVNVTLVFQATQALIAAKVGATFVSPFVGRLDDIATDGMHVIEEIVEIFDNYDYATEVLVASVRHPIHVVQAARMGADVCTCPPSVFESMFKHPLTDLGLERFLKDWEKAQAEHAAKV